MQITEEEISSFMYGFNWLVQVAKTAYMSRYIKQEPLKFIQKFGEKHITILLPLYADSFSNKTMHFYPHGS